MCGRYAASASTDELVEALDIEADRTNEPVRSVLAAPQDPPPGAPDHNLAPTKAARVVVCRVPRGAGPQAPPERALRLLTWGLVPPWSRDVKSGVRMVNARAETVLTKRAFAPATRARRCLVPASGWYEWQASPSATDAKGRPRKQPFFVHRVDDVPVTFAGLYEFWKDPDAAPDDPLAWLSTFTIITTAAEPGLDRIHDRQPLVLDPEHWTTWLDPERQDEDTVRGLLAAPPPGRFAAHPVGRAVGSARANGPALLEPAPTEELVGVVDPMTGEVIGG